MSKPLRRGNNVNFRLNEYEMRALKELVEYWNVSYSEATRRAIIYTYFKFLKRRDVDVEELIKERDNINSP